MESHSDLDFINAQIMQLESSMHETIASKKSLLEELHNDQVVSAKNLLSYLTLRNLDIRELQDLLHIYGFSSLASSEGHILRQVQAIRERLGKVYPQGEHDLCTYAFSKLKMGERSRLLFGQKTEAPIPYMMVTFDQEFADDYSKVISLLQNGMNIARINCAHDDEFTWLKMINQVRKASEETGIPCKIYMDLAGPKIRTKILGKGNDKGKVKIKEGQLIWMLEDDLAVDKSQVVISPNEKGIIHQLKKGDRVFIDDGTIHCLVDKIRGEKIGLRVVRISSKKGFLKEGKGINFPDSLLQVASLTDFDRICLPFISEHADLVGYSFVKTGEDIADLRLALQKISENYPQLIIKIETLQAVENLPSLLFEGMKEQAFGVMIARGDLAVEIGFERLGEIQEEILWICEAGHVPVVWATQVLESLHKSGMVTRSEITDAGHAAMAECVMINKGDYTIEVMETLRDVIHRTSTHRVKKRFTLRPLKIAQKFLLPA